MNKGYTYIIASIPFLRPDYKPSEGDCSSTLEWIGSQLEGRDRQMLEVVRSGFIPENLDEGFYRDCLASPSRFIREFFLSDLQLRNAKTDYLNDCLGRPHGQDTIVSDGIAVIAGGDARIEGIFKTNGLLERERAIDGYMWTRIDEICALEDFSLDRLLGIVAKLCIIQRWLALDPVTGREMLRSLVAGVRGTYDKLEFETFR